MESENEKPKYSGYGYHGGGRPKGSKNKSKRPKSENTRCRNIGIRVSEAELSLIKEKARAAGLSITDFIVRMAEQS